MKTIVASIITVIALTSTASANAVCDYFDGRDYQEDFVTASVALTTSAALTGVGLPLSPFVGVGLGGSGSIVANAVGKSACSIDIQPALDMTKETAGMVYETVTEYDYTGTANEAYNYVSSIDYTFWN